VLLITATTAIPQDAFGAILSLNSTPINYTKTLSASDLSTLRLGGTILIPFSAITGSQDMIADGYYNVSMTFQGMLVDYNTNIQTFAVINRIKTLYYASVNYVDVNIDIASVKKTMKILLLLQSLLVLGENPGNSTDFWNKYNYVLAQLS
jgi:hypothetical protein